MAGFKQYIYRDKGVCHVVGCYNPAKGRGFGNPSMCDSCKKQYGNELYVDLSLRENERTSAKKEYRKTARGVPSPASTWERHRTARIVGGLRRK